MINFANLSVAAIYLSKKMHILSSLATITYIIVSTTDCVARNLHFRAFIPPGKRCNVEHNRRLKVKSNGRVYAS